MQLAGNDADEEIEHEQQTYGHDTHNGSAQTVESAKDVTLRTDNSHRATRFAEGLVEHITVSTSDVHAFDALLTALHGVTKIGYCGIGILDGLGEDRLTGDFRRVRVHEIRTASTYHNTIRIGIGLDGGDGLREPVQRKAGIDDTNQLSFIVLDGLTIRGHHLARIRCYIEIDIRFRPARMIEQLRHQIPVHEEILVAIAAALNCTDTIARMLRISGEIASVILEVIRFEGDGAVVEVGIIRQHPTTIHKHRVGLGWMTHHEPLGHVRGHFHAIQDALHTQRGLVEYLRRMTDGLLPHCFTRLIEQETECSDEDDGSKHNDPETHSDGEFATDIC